MSERTWLKLIFVGSQESLSVEEVLICEGMVGRPTKRKCARGSDG